MVFIFLLVLLFYWGLSFTQLVRKGEPMSLAEAAQRCFCTRKSRLTKGDKFKR